MLFFVFLNRIIIKLMINIYVEYLLKGFVEILYNIF